MWTIANLALLVVLGTCAISPHACFLLAINVAVVLLVTYHTINSKGGDRDESFIQY